MHQMDIKNDAHPGIHSQFLKRNFAMKKTMHSFSAVASGQADKQTMKGDGGGRGGLTDKVAAL